MTTKQDVFIGDTVRVWSRNGLLLGECTAQTAACAPELLEALRAIVEAEEGPGETDRPHMITARAAIAKASA